MRCRGTAVAGILIALGLHGGTVHAEADGRIHGIDLVWHWEGRDGTAGSYRADSPVNPASVVKLATTLWALDELGPGRRFRTTFAIRGEIDAEAGVLHGDLLVIGEGDPDFHEENAQLVARELGRAGIRHVEGGLYVNEAFWIGWERGSEGRIADPGRRAAEMADRLARAWDPRRWSAATLRGMRRLREAVGQELPFTRLTVREVRGLDRDGTGAVPLFEHLSNPLVTTLKRFNDYSNNDIERLGYHLGDGRAMTRYFGTRWHGSDPPPSFETLSGLGSNRMSARQVVRLLKDLGALADRLGLALADLMPAYDCGRNTLRNYRGLAAGFPRASLVAKTGTLVQTDGGVVALGGTVATARGDVAFFIAAPRNGARMSAARRAQTRWLLDRARAWAVVGGECGQDRRFSYSGAEVRPVSLDSTANRP